MLNKKELKFLTELLDREGVSCKGSLKKVIYFNSHSSKYKIGDKVIYTDYRCKVYGNVVKDVVGTVTNIRCCECEGFTYQYTLEIKYKVIDKNGKEIEHLSHGYPVENQGNISRKTTRNEINIIHQRDQYSEELGL